jgi:carotenoid cleavage dioxygenase-like enzyme
MSRTEITTNRYLSGNYAPVVEEVTAFDLRVTGALPPELDGRLLRIGPNPMVAPDPATYHWFTGAGMVHGVRLRDGRAEWYRNRVVRSERSVNTNVIGHAGRTLALVEAGSPPVELTDDLETVRSGDFEGTLTGGFTAHPKRHPATGELHAVTYYWEWEHLRYVVVGADGRVRRTVEVPVTDGPMVHDMAVTEHHALLFDLPVTFDLGAAMGGSTFPYRWNDDHPARIGLLPLEGGADDVRWVEVDPCYVYHSLNAFDGPGGEVVLDVVRHERTFEHNRLGPDEERAPTLERWTIGTGSGSGAVHRSPLAEQAIEFPRHDERLVGRRHRYGYGVGVGADLEFGPIRKVDVDSGAVEEHDFGPGRSAMEPVFVPRSADAAEDDGWLLTYVHDAATDRSDVVILDARDVGGDPVAVVHLPVRVPFGFHGNWVPAT